MKNQSLILVPRLLAVIFASLGSASAASDKNESNVLKYYNRLETRVDNHETRINKLEVEDATERQVDRQPRQFSASVNTTSANLGRNLVTTAPVTKGYTVKKGDSLSKIARVTGTSTTTLKKLNKLTDESVLRIGQNLITSSKTSTPVTTTTTTDRPVTTTTETKVVTDKYVIKSGDTISKIAKKNNVSISALRKANGLSEGSSLRAGRALNIPRTVTTTQPVKTREQTISVSRQSYEIKGQDTFYSLANHYGISVKELQEANPGVDPAKLRPGTIIKIPVKSAPSQPVNTEREDSRENIREVSNEPVTGPTARDLHTRGDAKKPSQNMSRDHFEPVNVEDDGSEVPRNTIDPHMDYTVEPGDTWESIAAQFKTSRDEMKKINGIRGTDEPVTGTSISVPRSRVGHKAARSANRAA